MNKILKVIKKYYKWLFFLIFFIMSLYLINNHELWRDEAQNYLLVRDLSFKELLLYLKYEGHSFVWYLILKLFVLLGLPYRYILLLPFTLINIAVFLLIKYNPFKISIIAILLSPLFLIFGASICRSYALATLLIVLLMLIYDKRYNHPYLYGILLFLLINTHILFFGFIISLLIIDLIEILTSKKQKVKLTIPITIAVLGIVLTYLQLRGGNGLVKVPLSLNEISIYIKYYFEKLYNYIVNYTYYLPFTLIGIFTFLYYIIYLIIKKEYKNLFILIMSISFIIYVDVYIFGISDHIVSIVWDIVLFSMYAVKEKKLMLYITVYMLFFSMVPYSLELFMLDNRYLYSDSYNVANYINETIKEGETIYVLHDSYASSVIAYLPKGKYNFKNVLNNNIFTFTNWDLYNYDREDERIKEIDTFDDEVIYFLGEEKNISNYFKKDTVTILYTSDDDFTLTDERYILLYLGEMNY